jgi:hypothetical protein
MGSCCLKIRFPDGTRETNRIFDNIGSTLRIARWILAACPDLRIAITVPPNATEAERYFVTRSKIESQTNWSYGAVISL